MTALQLKQRLIDLLDTALDGWVPIDLWEATEEAHKEVFNAVAQAVQSDEDIDNQSTSEKDLRRIWPFDIS